MDKERLDFLGLNSFSHHTRRFIVKSTGKRKVPITNNWILFHGNSFYKSSLVKDQDFRIDSLNQM